MNRQVFQILLFVCALSFSGSRGACPADSWAPIGPAGQAIRAIALSPHDLNLLIVGTNDGIYRRTSNDTLWRQVALPGQMVVALVADPFSPARFYAGVIGGGIWLTNDNGDNWRQVLPDSLTIMTFSIPPDRPSEVYAGTTTHGVMFSWNSGENWVFIGPQNTSVQTIQIPAVAPDIVYIGTTIGLFKSQNRGNNWIPTGIEFGSRDIRTLAVDPHNNQLLYAGTKGSGIWISHNGGIGWWPNNDGLTHIFIRAIAMDPNNNRKLYAGTHGNGIFTSDDGGGQWRLSGLDNQIVLTTQIHPLDNRRVYAGSGKAGVYQLVRETVAPQSFRVLQNYPNPFRAITTIQYDLPVDSDVTLEFYDVAGRKVDVMRQGRQLAGTWRILWEPKGLSSGIYFVQVKTEQKAQVIKMALIR
jgi:photosystem II stability/assembly factor-like uncharacterized protein